MEGRGSCRLKTEFCTCALQVPDGAAVAAVSPKWLLDRIHITDTATGTTRVFPCGQWPGADEEGCVVSGRSLLPVAAGADATAEMTGFHVVLTVRF